MIKIFIGFDPREAVAYHVLTQSILDRASMPVSITPLALKNLDFKRKRDSSQSTDFSFTRFLVPYLCNYQGSAIFMDCDMLVQDDIAKLWAMRGENAVRVVSMTIRQAQNRSSWATSKASIPRKTGHQ